MLSCDNPYTLRIIVETLLKHTSIFFFFYVEAFHQLKGTEDGAVKLSAKKILLQYFFCKQNNECLNSHVTVWILTSILLPRSSIDLSSVIYQF